MNGTTKSDRARSGQYLQPDNKAVLGLVGDELSRELILAVLGTDYRVTIASTPREAEWLLASFGYRLVIVTNLGILPKQAVSVIPMNHAYPVLFLSGYFDRQLQEECARKRIRHMGLPFAVAELRQAVVDALDERTAFGRSQPDAEPSEGSLRSRTRRGAIAERICARRSRTFPKAKTSSGSAETSAASAGR